MTIVCDCCGELTYPENADDEMDRETTHTCHLCTLSLQRKNVKRNDNTV